MVDEATTKDAAVTADIPFVESLGNIERSEHVPYLGDQSVLESILRNVTANVMDAITWKGSNETTRMKVIRRERTKAAKILLGRTRSHMPIRKWNRAGGIDVFCAKWLGLAETDPLERMEHAVMLYINECIELTDVVEIHGIKDEAWVWQLDAILQRYVLYFLGVDTPTQATM